MRTPCVELLQVSGLKQNSPRCAVNLFSPGLAHAQVALRKLLCASCSVRVAVCASWRETAPGKVLCANWSVQVGLRKLLYASCTVQVAPRKLLRASCSGKLVPASGSLQVALCKLRSLQVALCKLLCASCSVQVALRKLLCASCSRQGALRKLVGASWSAQVALCNLLCASCFKMQVASCDARPRTREESNPRPAGSGSRRANHETTPEDQFEQQKSQKTCTSIPAEGRAGTLEIAKNHRFLHLDHADPRRGSSEHVRNRKKTSSFCTKSQKHNGILHLDHADPRRGSREHRRNRKKTMGFDNFAVHLSQRPQLQLVTLQYRSTADNATGNFAVHLSQRPQLQLATLQYI